MTLIQAPHSVRRGADETLLTSFNDLADDFADMQRVIAARRAGLQRLRADLERPGSGVPPWVRGEVLADLRQLLARDADMSNQLSECAGKADRSRSPELLEELTDTRRRLAELIRARQALAAALMVAADWHSPSAAHSVHSTAGRHQGRVTVHHDDYKRDRHPDAAIWEHDWIYEMVDNPGEHPLRALMAGSGMAAFTTVLTYVTERIGPGPVLMGTSIYHECRELLTRSKLGSRIVSMPEGDLDAWRSAITRAPVAVFLDSLCNAAGLAVPDLRSLIGLLHRSGRQVFLVVDNTARSVTCQPWPVLPRTSLVRMLVLESLTKYPQLGLDRAAGGVIVCRRADAHHLDALREHLGTNIADAVMHQHLRPDRHLLERRLRRIGRNAQVIAEVLDNRVSAAALPLRIGYPGLATHPAHELMTGSDFNGGYLSIETDDRERAVELFPALIKTVLRLGAQRGVAICEGTSFGLDTTRIYLTAATPRFGAPFLRVSAGAEHWRSITEAADVLADAVEETE